MKRVFIARKRFCASFAALILFIIGGASHAQGMALPLAHASQLQPPVWLERGGR